MRGEKDLRSMEKGVNWIENQVNNYIVMSYTDVIVVTNTVTRTQGEN